MDAFFKRLFRSLRIKHVRPYIKGKVLDLACGPGEVLSECKDEISHYCGVDINESEIAILRTTYPNATFHKADLEAPFPDLPKDFDVVVMLASIGYIFDQKQLLSQMMSHLKDDGVIVLTSPSPFGDMILYWGTKLGLFAPSGDQDKQFILYSKRRARLAANKMGLEIKKFSYFELFCNQLIVLKKQHSF